MSLVNAETGEVIAEATPEQARERADRIRVALGVSWDLIVEAYRCRDWSALGHGSWDSYCSAEFGSARIRLPREERSEVVESLREQGMSIRAIASATLLMLVVRGLDQAAQDVMDTGSRRSASDMLSMAGKQNTAILGSVARLCVGWNGGTLRTSGSHINVEISHSEIKALVETDPIIEWAVSRASATTGIAANPTSRAFAAWLIGRVDAGSARDFLESVNEMRTDGAGDPRLTLIRRLQTSKDQKERLTSIEQAWLIVRAWDAWINGLPLKRLQLTSHGAASAFPSSVRPVAS